MDDEETPRLAFEMVLIDGRKIATIRDASLFFATLTPEDRDESHWRIAIRMLRNAVNQPTYTKAATTSLQTALVIEDFLFHL